MMGALCATYSLEHLGPQSHRFELDEFVARFEAEFDSKCDIKQLLQ
jgi:hypothetical protein